MILFILNTTCLFMYLLISYSNILWWLSRRVLMISIIIAILISINSILLQLLLN